MLSQSLTASIKYELVIRPRSSTEANTLLIVLVLTVATTILLIAVIVAILSASDKADLRGQLLDP